MAPSDTPDSDDAVLVDVVETLHAIDDRGQVQHLIGAPPRRVGPGVRHDVDLLGAGERADRAVADRRVGRASADAAVQLDAHLVAARRIVVVGHVDGEEVLDAVRRAVLHPDDAGVARDVGAATLQSSVRLVEADAGAEDRLSEPRRFVRRRRRPECLERGVAAEDRAAAGRPDHPPRHTTVTTSPNTSLRAMRRCIT